MSPSHSECIREFALVQRAYAYASAAATCSNTVKPAASPVEANVERRS
jgi:hypothetical protein